jgi:exodeoxyribonuclease VII large subunit
MENILNSKKHSLEIVQGKVKLITPYSLIQNNQAILNERTLTLNNIIDKKLLEANHNLEYLINSLKLVNPLNILSKGYSLVKHDDVLINNSDDINIGDEISIKLYKGEIKGIVKEIKNERENV